MPTRNIVPLIVTLLALFSLVALVSVSVFYGGLGKQMSVSLQIPAVNHVYQSIPAAKKKVPLPSPEPPQESLKSSVEADLFVEADFYPLEKWALRPEKMGFIDSIIFDTPVENDQGAIDDVIFLSGWAGHTFLGMRFPQVIFSVCGVVVGAVKVGSLRPDVASAVNINLKNSGWSATIPVAALPECKARVIKAYGVPPKGKNVWSLNNDVPLPTVPETGEPAFKIIRNAETLSPTTAKEPVFAEISIKASKARIRKCPSESCEILDHKPKGHYKSIIIEKSGNWRLVQFESGAGWIHASLIAQ